MKTLLLFLLALAIIVTGYNAKGIFTPGSVSALPGGANATDKYDGDCPTPPDYATAGRCADKCPANTSEGVYYLQGYAKDTGAAVCSFSYYHPCPYADAQPADSAVCQKLTEENTNANSSQPANVAPVADPTFTGK